MIDLNNYTVTDCAGKECENTDLIAALDDNLKAMIAENKRLKAELKKTQVEFNGIIYLNGVQRDQMKSMEEEMQSYAGCLARARDELKQLKEANRWIPVKERLPEVREASYLCFIQTPIGNYIHIRFFRDNGTFNDNHVTHWKLPIKFPEVDHAHS